MKNKSFLILLLIPFLFSFAGPTELQKFEKAFKKLMLGKWQAATKSGSFIEKWEQKDAKFLGYGAWEKDGKVSSSEEIELVNTGDKLLYSVKNGTSENVNFQLNPSKSNLKDKVFLFENPTHDFPRYILYKFTSAGKVHVRVSSVEEKTDNTAFTLALEKIK